MKLRLLPMLNAQLEGKNYFCGNGQITGYDLQVFCEISSMRVFAEDLIEDALQEQNNVQAWMKRIELLQEVKEKEQEFKS